MRECIQVYSSALAKYICVYSINIDSLKSRLLYIYSALQMEFSSLTSLLTKREIKFAELKFTFFFFLERWVL